MACILTVRTSRLLAAGDFYACRKMASYIRKRCSVTVDFSLLWPRRLSSSLRNSEVREKYVGKLFTANFETKLATSVPKKLVTSELVLFLFGEGKTMFSSEWNSLLKIILWTSKTI